MIWVKNMTNAKGNKVANQFIITDTDTGIKYLQSCGSIIVRKTCNNKIYLDERYWLNSEISGKYRDQFLNESLKETQAKIASGKYILTDLNS